MRGRREEGGKHGRREEVRQGERILRDRADVTRSHRYEHFVSSECFVKPVYILQHVGY